MALSPNLSPSPRLKSPNLSLSLNPQALSLSQNLSPIHVGLNLSPSLLPDPCYTTTCRLLLTSDVVESS